MARQSRKSDSIASTARLDMPQKDESNGSTALLEPPVNAAAEPESEALPVEVPEPAIEARPEPSDSELEALAWRADIHAEALEVRRLEQVYHDVAERSRKAKKNWEEASTALNDKILDEPKPMPLFDKPAPAIASANGEPKKTRKPKKGKATDEPLPIGDEAWRSVSIDTLELSAGTCELLIADGKATIGALTDHTSKGLNLADIPGIGAAKSGAIEAALEKFWADKKAADIALAALRQQHVSALPLSEEITKYLDHVGLRTVGSLADWPAKTGKDYTQMNGVAGPNGADIASALAVFLAPPVAGEPAPALEAVA